MRILADCVCCRVAHRSRRRFGDGGARTCPGCRSKGSHRRISSTATEVAIRRRQESRDGIVTTSVSSPSCRAEADPAPARFYCPYTRTAHLSEGPRLASGRCERISPIINAYHGHHNSWSPSCMQAACLSSVVGWCLRAWGVPASRSRGCPAAAADSDRRRSSPPPATPGSGTAPPPPGSDWC